MIAKLANRSLQHRLMLGVSTSAMVLSLMAVAPSQAQVNPFGRRPDPAAQAGRAAADQAQQGVNATTVTQRALQSFGRAAETRRAMDAAQSAARAAALAGQSNVPNGLVIGGLQIDRRVETDPTAWMGADAPTQTTGADGRTDVNIQQTEQRAILNWETFNVGRETDLTFNQGGTDWVALNRVNDPNAAPSQILGTISAPGTVMILNRNGVIFTGSSQINTRNLVAAAADLGDDQFLTNGIYSRQEFGQLSPSFTNALGDVRVEAGAQIKTNDPASVTQAGGYVMLLGANVENAGSVTTNRGQTLLAAGDEFLIRPGVSTEANRYSTTRGNEVNATRASESLSGAITNSGLIAAAQGDITLTGHAVAQNGVALSTTSVNQRGTIHLLNAASDAEGSVTLGENSLTAILPELDSEDTAVNAQRDALIAESAAQDLLRVAEPQFDNLSILSDRRDQSRVEIVTGGNAVFEAGSITLAQGGQVAVSAADRVQVRGGAEINVSGVRDVMLDMNSNAIRVNIQGNELRDAPANREADRLRNENVWVDVRDLIFVPDGTGGYEGDRYYTPGGLLEVGGTLGLQTRTIGEWAAVGGTITLQGNEVVADRGSVFDISGGSLQYRSGAILSTRVLGEDGKFYDIGNAPAGVRILSIGAAHTVTHERWGPRYTEVFASPFNRGLSSRYEEGYTVGRDAGRLQISAPTTIFEGDVVADVITGGRQTLARPDGVLDGYKLSQDMVARAGTLAIGRVTGIGPLGTFDTDVVIADIADVTDQGASLTPLPEDRINTTHLDADRLNGFGLGGLDLTTAGAISIDEALTLDDGGLLSLTAAITDINADVTIRSGSVQVDNVGSNLPPEPPIQTLTRDGEARFTLAEGVTLDLSGVWTNGALDDDVRPSTAHIDGGDLSVRMVKGSVILAADSTVDVSSGATLFAGGELEGGRGGDVSLIAGASLNDLVQETNPVVSLVLDGDIRAQGVVGGGTLTLQSPNTVVIGEDALLSGGLLPAGQATPTGVILADDVIVPAGGVVPIGRIEVFRTTLPDVPAPQDLQPALEGPIVTAADWVIPDGVSLFDADFNFRQAGELLPAGTTITFFNGSIPAGTVTPADVFPDGIPVAQYQLNLQAGDVTPVALTYAAGLVVGPGVVFAEDVAVNPALNIDTGLFQSGFSDYRITSLAGLGITEGVEIRPEVPVMRLTPQGASSATGTDPSTVLESWTPPVFLENVASGRLTQREGAALSLRGTDVTLADGASIAVDPGETVRLAAAGQITIDGDITARGGDILLLTEQVGTATISQAAQPGRSIWIGGGATLDASGLAYTALDRDNRLYGLVQDGGSIRIGVEDDRRAPLSDSLLATQAHVVIRDGAVLDASGASAEIDIDTDGGVPNASRRVRVAGDGGLIRLGSTRAVVIDGDMRAAAGGEGASGGTLNLVLEGGQEVRVLTVAQDRADDLLAPDSQVGTDDPSLVVGTARISVEEIEAGGFGSLELWSRDVFSFAGDVDLAMDESLILRRGVLSVADTTLDARVSLSAPYVLLDGRVEISAPEPGLPAPGLVGPFGFEPGSSARLTGALSIRADLIDVSNGNYFGASGFKEAAFGDFGIVGTPVDYAGFGLVDILSRGDLRFTPSIARDGALLSTGGDLLLTAAQLYPTIGATGEIQAGISPDLRSYDPERTLTIRGHGGETPDAPLSVFGRLTLTSANIDQGGIVRAPLGTILFGERPGAFGTVSPYDVTLRDGSVTSTSAAGLMLPYGGTVDGLAYLYNGVDVEFLDLAATTGGGFDGSLQGGIIFGNSRLDAQEGSLLDLSGGGELLGAGFFTGRVGSVDVLRTALANANPAYEFSAPDAEVYAIVPGNASAYAPVTPDAGAGAPLVGRQITLDAPVGDLPAGTYTLMPSTFALLPGAFRVELGGQGLADGTAFDLPDGSFRANAYLGTANTAVRDILPTAVTLTPADAVRTFSQYNETSYAEFAVANAAIFGAVRPRLERDALNLELNFGGALGEVLSFDGKADLGAEEGGVSGALFVTAINPLEVKSADAEATEGFAAVDADDLSAIGAGALVVGGKYNLVQAQSPVFEGNEALGPRIVFTSNLQTVAVRDGATLRAGQIFQTGQDVLVEGGAVLDTTAGPTDGISSTLGYVFSDTSNDRDALGGAILTVANGFLNFTAPLNDEERGPNSITVQDGAALRTLGTIGFSTNGPVTLGESELNARFLTLSVPSLNIGTTDSFAAAEAAGVLGSGVRFSQSVLERLLRPTTAGQRPVERISLTVGESINLFGDLDLNLLSAGGGQSTALVLNAPAIYGWGEADDVARITTDTLIWNGLAAGVGRPASPIVSLTPGPVTPGGAGTGSGQFVIDADRIVFGYDPLARTQNQTNLDRLILGFADVRMNAGERITANNRGTLSVYQGGIDADTYAGGTLTLTTPVLTGDAGSFMAYRAGGALTVTAPTGSTPFDTAAIDALGAEVRLAGQTVSVDTAVALPSGRLVVEAQGDITLTDRADIDLAGRAVEFFDVTRYSWGGDLVLESTDGEIRQAAGSTIDISAEENDAGTIKVTATGEGGEVDLAGALLGATTTGFDSGAIDVRATVLDDFAGLNRALTSGGLFEARSFVIKTGDLVVGDEVRAQRVTLSVDGGSLTVNGRIDASGEDVGTIRLAARDDLTLASGAVLDVHGTELVTDSHGQAIEASNRGEVELTTVSGTVNLASGATIDLRSADAVSRGRLEINAPRIGGGDVAVNAATGLTVRGADSIAVNAFATYTPGDGTITQGYLDGIHADSAAFIDAALVNGAVDARLAGLASYGDAFHLRPGVEIRGDGDLVVDGDLDLSGYRYGPDADGAIRGSGEPGVLTIRADGDLTVKGSISDGFLPPPATPDDARWIGDPFTLTVVGGEAFPSDITFEPPFNPDPNFSGPWLVFPGFYTGEDIPVLVSGSIQDNRGSYGPGDSIPFLFGQITIAEGTVLSTVDPANATISVETFAVREGIRSWALSDMLAPGALSWSMRLVGGADLASADSRTLTALNTLDGRGDVILNSPGEAGSGTTPNLSVIRTGTGYLDVLAGGDYRQTSLFGVYTAGTQVEGSGPWNLDRAPFSEGTVLGDPEREATLNAQRMYFTQGGGDLLLAAQGDVRGFKDTRDGSSTDDVGRWLWRQGGDELGQLTAWGVNFGQYAYNVTGGAVELVGFTGIGALGGGDVTVLAGGDAGSTSNVDVNDIEFTTTALNVVVAGSGRVTQDGQLIQTGGGDLTLKVGGRLNKGLADQELNTTISSQVLNLRGDVRVSAGSVGQTQATRYGLRPNDDPRAVDTREPTRRNGYSPLGLSIGDGVLRVASRGDLVIVTGRDPGRLPLVGGRTAASFDGVTDGAATSFTLWTDRSRLELFSAGGDVSQSATSATQTPFGQAIYDPGQVSIVAADGSIALGSLALAPSLTGDLELLARHNVSSDTGNLGFNTGEISMSSGSPAFLATPLNPLWLIGSQFNVIASNIYASDVFAYGDFFGGNLFAFGPNTATDLHAGTADPIRIYAVEGDLTIQTGAVDRPTPQSTELLYRVAKPVRMLAGRDILASGLILNNDPNDVSVIRAGRDILNTTIDVAGPGVLEVSAGRNIYQAPEFADGTINSIGPVVVGDTRDGAGITLIAGVGAAGPDYAAFAALYLDAANRADPERPLADQDGKVVKTYDQELVDWLKGLFGYDGGADDALAYFQALEPEQQAVFVRDVYFEELRLAGREYNDPDSGRFNSYLRGRNAIAVLLPDTDADGQPAAYDGSITFQKRAGVHTDFGGDIQVLVPGGGLTLGATGVAPPPSTGLLTQGSGDIEVFTKDSILLGLSRVFTTFGGGITMWSAEGDINAGRGAKGTVVFAPAKRTYDDYGNVDLSPTVPTSGAGIGTLNPIPEVPPGDIDLIAPLGTIDAGEAGIRVSGNVNLAALQVLNAANIEVQGEATGIPVAAAVNTGALTAAAGATAAVANEAAQLAERRRPEPIRDLPAIITSRFLGFGEE